MSSLQLAYFRAKLMQWKSELLNESEDTLAALQEQSLSTPEAVERASMETDHASSTELYSAPERSTSLQLYSALSTLYILYTLPQTAARESCCEWLVLGEAPGAAPEAVP